MVPNLMPRLNIDAQLGKSDDGVLTPISKKDGMGDRKYSEFSEFPQNKHDNDMWGNF